MATARDDHLVKNRFTELCNALKMDQSLTDRSWEVLERVLPLVEMKQSDEPFWFTCGILTCLVEARADSLPVQFPALGDVLQQAGVRIVDIFEPMQSFIELAKPKGMDIIKKEMDQLARRFIVVYLFTQKYRDVFSSILRHQMDVRAGSEYCFGWLLFLETRAVLLENSADVVQLLNLLLCCMDLVYVLSPPEMRKEVLPAGDDEQQGLALLAQLYSASLEDLKATYYSQFLPCVLSLCQQGVLQLQSEGAQPKISELVSVKQLEGLLGAEIMEGNISRLRDAYMARLKSTFTINELALLEQPETIGTPSKMPPKMKQYYNYDGPQPAQPVPERIGEKSPSSPRSPVTPRTIRVTIPATPVTTTMQTLGWLERTLASQTNGPSKALKRYFDACANNPAASITDRVKNITSRVSFAIKAEKSQAEKRRQLAAKLYYRLLEAMLNAEEQRLQTKEFGALLSQDMFHRSLIACCMEITAYCYKLDNLRYPAIPEKLEIEPFEYCKIIENVLRHEVTIPLVLKRHLMRIEEQILEEDAWKSGSSLFSLLERPGQQEHIYQQFHVSGSQTASGGETPVAAPASAGAVTPGRLRKRAAMPLHSPAPAKVTKGAASGTPSQALRSRSLELFFKKVLSLANVRMQQLFKQMEIPAGLYHHLWFSFVHVLIWFPSIVKNRHIDQIIMCTLYGVCRANKLENVTFRKILHGYRHQPQASSSLWRNVLLENGEHGDIIKFYNEVYIVMLEDVLWKYQGRVPQQPAAYAPAASPMKVAPKYNLYLSPLKGTKFVSAESTGGGIRYNIGQSPAKGLEDINKNIVAVGSKRKASRRLDFTAMGLTSDVKRPRLDEAGSTVEEDVAGPSDAMESITPTRRGKGRRNSGDPVMLEAK